MKLRSVTWAALGLIGAAGSMIAASSANYTISPEVLDGGGGFSSSANYSLISSIEPFATGTSSSANYTLQHGYIPQLAASIEPAIVGRHIFYNQSAWDGNDAAANANDDAAIATDKVALVAPNMATFANYTSFSRGINGIMVDIANLPATPGTSDFTFRVGNNQSPALWAAAPAPTSITVRAGAGLSGSSRITIIWPNGAIAKQWLEVTVKSTAATGLPSDSKFYFGNAIGEVGNSASDALVTTTDRIRIRNNPVVAPTVAELNNPFDINRDKLVSTADLIQSRNNPTDATSALVLLNLGAGRLPGLAAVSGATVNVATLGSGPGVGVVGGNRAAAVGAGSSTAVTLGPILTGARLLGTGELRFLFEQLNPTEEYLMLAADSVSSPTWAPVRPQPKQNRGATTAEISVPASSESQFRYFRLISADSVDFDE